MKSKSKRPVPPPTNRETSDAARHHSTEGGSLDPRCHRRNRPSARHRALRRLRPRRPQALQRRSRPGADGEAHLDRLLDLRPLGRRLHLRRVAVPLRPDRLAGAAGDDGRHSDRLRADEPDRTPLAPRGHSLSGHGPGLDGGDGREPRGADPPRRRSRRSSCSSSPRRRRSAPAAASWG